MPASSTSTKQRKSKKTLNTTAYLLGYRAVWLLSRLEMAWVFAELDQPLPQHFPSTVNRVVRALEDLAPLLPKAKRTKLLRVTSDVVNAVWDKLRITWQGNDHRERMQQRDASEPEAAWEVMMDDSDFPNTPYLRRQFEQFCLELPDELFGWTLLGRLVAEVWDADPNATPAEWGKVDFVARLEDLLRDLKLTEVDLSEQAARERPAGMTYIGWVQQQVAVLHQQLVLGGTNGKEAEELMLSPKPKAASSTAKTMLTPPEIAAMWQVSPDKVLAWIRDGKLRASNMTKKPGGRPRYLVHVDDLEAFRLVLQKQGMPVSQQRQRPEKEPADFIPYFSGKKARAE